jgi:hypothetical protein
MTIDKSTNLSCPYELEQHVPKLSTNFDFQTN